MKDPNNEFDLSCVSNKNETWVTVYHREDHIIVLCVRANYSNYNQWEYERLN